MANPTYTMDINPGETVLIRCSGAMNMGNNNNSENPILGLGAGANQEGGKKNRKTRKNNMAGGKRGPNPFMKFAAKERKNIMNENPGMKVTDVGKELGKRWRALSDAEKKKY